MKNSVISTIIISKKLDATFEDASEIERDVLLEESVFSAPSGMIMEFGVFSGNTINRIASATHSKVYGFDSFEGLSEPWNGMNIGYFAAKLPEVRENVELVVGLFQNTLDNFLESHLEDVAFCHIDCDLYSSTDFVLRKLESRFKKGSIILFDEIAHYPGYLNHEYKAFLEFLDYSNFDFECIGRRNQHGYAYRLC